MEFRTAKEESFDKLYRSYADNIYKVCLHLTENEDLAQDIMQQTFINAYDYFEDVNPNCIYAYLVRAAKNLIYNYQRDSKREISTEMIYEEGHPEELASESLEEAYLQHEKESLQENLSVRILEDLREKNEDYYKILMMIFFYNKSHDEISKELGVTKEVLYSRIRRAKLWVRKHYMKDYEELLNRT